MSEEVRLDIRITSDTGSPGQDKPAQGGSPASRTPSTPPQQQAPASPAAQAPTATRTALPSIKVREWDELTKERLALQTDFVRRVRPAPEPLHPTESKGAKSKEETESLPLPIPKAETLLPEISKQQIAKRTRKKSESTAEPAPESPTPPPAPEEPEAAPKQKRSKTRIQPRSTPKRSEPTKIEVPEIPKEEKKESGSQWWHADKGLDVRWHEEVQALAKKTYEGATERVRPTADSVRMMPPRSSQTVQQLLEERGMLPSQEVIPLPRPLTPQRSRRLRKLKRQRSRQAAKRQAAQTQPVVPLPRPLTPQRSRRLRRLKRVHQMHQQRRTVRQQRQQAQPSTGTSLPRPQPVQTPQRQRKLRQTKRLHARRQQARVKRQQPVPTPNTNLPRPRPAQTLQRQRQLRQARRTRARQQQARTRRQRPPRPVRARLVPPTPIQAAGRTALGALRGAIGPAVGAGVGAATASGTLGAVAGTGASILATALPPPVTIALGTVALAATAVKEGFDRLRSTLKEAGQALKQLNGPVAGAHVQAEIRELRSRLQQGQRVGEKVASGVEAESRIETALIRLQTSLIDTFGNGIVRILEALEGLIAITTEVSKIIPTIFSIIENLPTTNPILAAALNAIPLVDKVVDLLGQIARSLRPDSNETEDVQREQALFFGISPAQGGAAGWRQRLEDRMGRARPAALRAMGGGVGGRFGE